jgi:MoxR-like ATPase
VTFSVPTPGTAFTDTLDRIRAQIGERIVGQTDVIDEVLVAFLARGHVLLEGVPGTAKTLLVRTLAETRAVRAHPVHARSHAVGYHRRERVRRRDADV